VPAAATNVVAIAAGLSHSVALRNDGKVVAWGQNFSRQTNVPPHVTNVTAIAAGDNHNVALRSDGAVIAWGDNTYRQTNVPPALTGVVRISAGSTLSVAHLADGSILAWGITNSVPFPSAAENRDIIYAHAIAAQTIGIAQAQPRIYGELQGDAVDLKVWGFAGRRYFLEHTANLDGGTWTETIPGGVAAEYGWNALVDANPPLSANRFYRLRAGALPP
jgi:hypothetical protein